MIYLQDLVLLFFLAFTLVLLITVILNIFYLVPFVPSKKSVIENIITLAGFKKGEKVFDLGCGDARFLIEAEKKAGIAGTGFEVAHLPLLLAYFNKLIHKSKIQIMMQNFYKADLSKADTIFCYLLPETMDRLSKKFQTECKKGTRIFSHTFHINNMKPVKVWTADKKNKQPTIYLYQI